MSTSEPEASSEQFNPDDLIKILVATDSHLGYNEKDNLRGNDSFIAFEEVLQNAVQNEVDFILLGGDLFHDAKPSPNTLQRCMKLLRTYTLGDKPIQLEFLSDQALNFAASMSQTVNYEDPNMNIAYPVFSIHGNHDDPSGFGRLSALDLLSTNGLVNYFGKWTDLTKINIAPILLRKGQTQLALYGLSYIQDCRLARLFEDTKVVLERPDAESGDWFNVMVLHQNRADRGPKNFLPEHILPDFIDLFVWGHEHDCRIVPERNTRHKFYVSQPGSSVATSLAEGESLPKHCGLLLVHGTQFKMEPIRLRTVRPFVFDTLDLSQHAMNLQLMERDAMQSIQDFIAERIESMIKLALEQHTGHPSQPTLPLIRLRIVYDAEVQMFNSVRFGNTYSGRVANPIDIILFKKQTKRVKSDVMPVDQVAMNEACQQTGITEHTRVEDIVNRYFAEADSSAKLEVLYPKSMNEICRRLVDYDDDDALDNMLKLHHERACAFLNNRMPPKEAVVEHLAQLELEADDIFEAGLQMLDSRGVNRPATTCVASVDTTTNDDVSVTAPKWSPIAARSNTVTSAAAKKNTMAAPKAATTSAARGGPGSRGGRGGRAASTRKAAGNKNELKISITPAKPSAESAAVQTSIMSSFATQSTRQSQRTAAAPARSKVGSRIPTQYISDSDSN